MLWFFLGKGEYSKRFPIKNEKEESHENTASVQKNATKQPDRSLGNT